MISSLWIAKTGLDAQQTNMDVIANNLANVSTNGFKRQRAVFEDLLYQTIRQPGAQSSELNAANYLHLHFKTTGAGDHVGHGFDRLDVAAFQNTGHHANGRVGLKRGATGGLSRLGQTEHTVITTLHLFAIRFDQR